jgi:multiple sugar transport system substrate-binding protein
MLSKKWLIVSLLAALLLVACQPQTVIVREVVTQVVEVEKEVTKIVAGTPVVEKVIETKVVEQEVVVTATPVPTVSPYDEGATIEVWVDTTRLETMDMWKELNPDKADLVNVTQFNRGQFANQVLLFNNVGSGWPDVIFAEPWIVSLLADAAHNYPADLRDWVPAEIIDGFAAGSLAPCTIEGKLYCLRNDLAQSMLYYDIPLMEEFGYEVPETWEEYIEIGEDVAANHPGYYIGACGDVMCARMYFAPSECPIVERLSISEMHSNPEHPNCVRAAEMLDHLVELGVVTTTRDRDPQFVEEVVKQGKLLMLIGPSWYGEYIYGGTEDSLFYQTAEGQLGLAVTPRWKDQDKNYGGYHGGAAWAMSRHTKNPKLASEIVIFATTGEYQYIAPTFPAYLPAAEKWAETVSSNALYGVDPYPVYKETAELIWPGWLEDNRFPWTAEWTRVIIQPVRNEGAKFADQLAPLKEALIPLGPPGGFEIITEP